MKTVTRNLFVKILCALTLSAFALPLWAHHSAAQYDFKTPVEVKGVVKVVRIENPHMKLILEVTDAKGKRDIEYEGHSLNNLYRQGYRPNLVTVGDTWEIKIAPRKDGGDGGYVVAVKTSDGHTF
jgi:Family of unknown function (DUF6152)